MLQSIELLIVKMSKEETTLVHGKHFRSKRITCHPSTQGLDIRREAVWTSAEVGYLLQMVQSLNHQVSELNALMCQQDIEYLSTNKANIQERMEEEEN